MTRFSTVKAIDTVTVLHPYYTIRAVGGTLYLIGFVMFAYNIYVSRINQFITEVEKLSSILIKKIFRKDKIKENDIINQ